MTEPSEEVQELIDAARYGDLEDVAAALDAKTPVNSTDELGRTGELFSSSISGCCCIESAAAVKTRHAAGVVMDQRRLNRDLCVTGLHMASANGHADVVRLLIGSGAVRMMFDLLDGTWSASNHPASCLRHALPC